MPEAMKRFIPHASLLSLLFYFTLPVALFCGALMGGRNLERIEQQAASRMEFFAILQPDLTPEEAKAFASSLELQPSWAAVRLMPPHEILALEEPLPGGFSHAVAVRSQWPVAQYGRALRDLESLDAQKEVEQVVADREGVRQLGSLLDFWRSILFLAAAGSFGCMVVGGYVYGRMAGAAHELRVLLTLWLSIMLGLLPVVFIYALGATHAYVHLRFLSMTQFLFVFLFSGIWPFIVTWRPDKRYTVVLLISLTALGGARAEEPNLEREVMLFFEWVRNQSQGNFPITHMRRLNREKRLLETRKENLNRRRLAQSHLLLEAALRSALSGPNVGSLLPHPGQTARKDLLRKWTRNMGETQARAYGDALQEQAEIASRLHWMEREEYRLQRFEEYSKSSRRDLETERRRLLNLWEYHVDSLRAEGEAADGFSFFILRDLKSRDFLSGPIAPEAEPQIEALSAPEQPRAIENVLFASLPSGESLHALAAGRVLYSGALPGLGHTVIIGVDDRFSLLYGHLADSSLATGILVEKGDILGIAPNRDEGISTVRVELRERGKRVAFSRYFALGKSRLLDLLRGRL